MGIPRKPSSSPRLRSRHGSSHAAGVDGFLIETVMDLREAVCALRGCREASKLPILVTMSFQTLRDGGRTAMGSQAADCGRTLSREGADAVGANCGDLDPHETAALIAASARFLRPAAHRAAQCRQAAPG